MKHNCIHIKLKDKNNIDIDLNNNKIFELFKLSAGNNLINLIYNKKQSSNKDIEINYYNKYKNVNIGKIIYENTKNNKAIKIFNKIFISNNKERTKIIINNKQYELKENIENKNQFFKVKIKFLDKIFNLNSMFRDCESLLSIDNFKNINTKYLKTIYDLFLGCSSLLYIDDISNWNLNNINYNFLLKYFF